MAKAKPIRRVSEVEVGTDADGVPITTLAEAVVEISKSVAKLRASGLNERAIVVLVKHETGISMADITRVLRALEKLEEKYTR